MSPIESLWGDEFNIPSTQEIAKKVISKISGQTEVQRLKSKKTPIEEKISLITQNVYKILGHLKDDTIVIKTREELHSYIDKSISNRIIAIDTETNNSVDTLTCKLMGGCIYTPGEKSAYIPINHINRLTGERLSWQLTEKDIKEEFDRLQDPSLNDEVKILTHNGKFDYKVLLKTTGFDMNIYWDSYVGARLLNENEAAGLKFQYIDKINPNQEKYDIEHLFEGMEYAIFDPDLFALYAATDAMMTYELYLWQKKAFEDPSLAGVYNLMMTEEMPLIKVVAKMELRGISLDKEYASRLSVKYHAQMEECLKKLDEEVNKYNDKVSKWRLTPDANNKNPNKKGDGFNKSKSEQLEDPIKISSPTQLAILLYDVLKCPSVSTKSPRGTGVDELKALAEKTNLPLCKIILEYRTLDKLLNTFIDKLPNDASDVDERVHCEFKSLGTDTGRFSSANPNLQQLPRSDITIKPMFRATPSYEKELEFDSQLELSPYDEIEIDCGVWIKAKNLTKENHLILEDGTKIIINSLQLSGDKITVYFC